MKNDVEQASASNKKKGIDVGSASGIDKDINNKSNSNMEKDIACKEGIVKNLQRRMVPLTSQQNRNEYCISMVPNLLRKVQPEAYTPQLISIGPLHHGNKRLKAMQEEKLRYFKKFIEHYKKEDEEKIRSLVSRIQANIENIKYCYPKDLIENINHENLIEMILLDAVFIIMFLKYLSYVGSTNEKFERRRIFDIRDDLMLPENEIPFFIIKEIYDEVCPGEFLNPFRHSDSSFFGMCTFLHGLTDSTVARGWHFTSLVRSMMFNDIQNFNLNPIKLRYSAVMLHKAGVEFQVAEDTYLVDIKFERGVLKMRRLEVDYRLERLVRNIMAWEQCYEPIQAYICSYIKFVDHLINSAEDVDLLVQKGIILHCLGDNAAVSTLINNLNKTIYDTYTCYNDICEQMNAHYENPWNNIKATLKRVYFTNVWRGTATVAAFILLILTLIQTITSVKSVF